MSGVSYFCTFSFNADAYLIAWPAFPTARCGCLPLKSVPEFCSGPVWCLCFAAVDSSTIDLEETRKSPLLLERCSCAGVLCGTVNGGIYSFSGCDCNFCSVLEMGLYCFSLGYIVFNTLVLYCLST